MEKIIRFSAICLLSFMLLFVTSCASVQTFGHDQGKHKGWYKNPNNPHHPASTKDHKKPKKI